VIATRTDQEIAVIERNCRLVLHAFDEIDSSVVPGAAPSEIAQQIEGIIQQHGAEASLRGYGFPAGVIISLNDAVTNAPPSCEVLRSGDTLTIDAVVRKDGYFGKAQRWYGLGQVSSAAIALHEAAEEALRRAIGAAVRGNRLSDISYAIGSVAEERGCGVVREYTGHGVGEALHEDPPIPCYGLPGRGPRFRQGMVLQIYVLFTEGKGGPTRIDDDHWTARTADGARACTLGHVVAVTNGSPRILTSRFE